ncbi:MAG TPA: alkaline phosphatase [Caulifigura sp.]|nr:alkaline phosphatase [Caulifigura sp.]
MSPFRQLFAAGLLAVVSSPVLAVEPQAGGKDPIAELQTAAATKNVSEFGHWGHDPENYKFWSTHSNRLIPIYTFGTKGAGKGVDLDSYMGENSLYRKADRIKELYGYDAPDTLNPKAEYCDQTDIYRIQRAAFDAGKKYVFLIVFDGMDWQTTRAAAIYKASKVGYDSGRGQGLHFQDYTAGGTTQFGYMVTSPHNEGTDVDVNTQTVKNPNGTMRGGYSVERGGPNPWTPGNDKEYPISKGADAPFHHAYTDSSSSATSMTTGVKTYNNCVNVDYAGVQVATIAHEAQREGYSVGAVSSVPICHATPAAAYAHNVHRDDYQDLSRDQLGLKSVAHPDQPLPGLDVLIGGGYGYEVKGKAAVAKLKAADTQGDNVVAGNLYLTDADKAKVDVKNGGKYVVATRVPGRKGSEVLREAAARAAAEKHRLLGFYGVGSAKGHLPFRTADGGYDPVQGKAKEVEAYTPEDISENPTLVDMAESAIAVLSKNPKGFWLMVEAGDVDWANHNNNIDDSIGATISGDNAVKAVTDWVEKNSNWNESLVIVTADHGHYLVIEKPELLVPAAAH